MRFYVGLHHPNDAGRFERAFISVHALARRDTPFWCQEWIMDSGAFTTILKHGGYPHPVSAYAATIRRWKPYGLVAAVTQDYMCEPFMLERTGLTIADHQRLTIERYDALLTCGTGGVYLMPVLQGYNPRLYVEHVESYGTRLKKGAWVGVGSICKRNGNPAAIREVLSGIKGCRPDLRLHGFGLKLTSLRDPEISAFLESADSMAWSFRARMEGRDANHWHEAKRFEGAITTAQDVIE